MNSDDIISSPLFAHNPEWNDVTPIYLNEAEQSAVHIAASKEFFDAFAYFRAILQTREMSMRVVHLVEECIRLNSANYSVWQYRRELIEALGMDLKKELKFISEVIEEGSKNYQIWHHRRYLTEKLGADCVPEELSFTALMLKDDAKNYHVWQHRHWILRQYFDRINVDDELSFALKLLLEDPRNNSAWNYRFTLLELKDLFGNSEQMNIEKNLCLKFIENMPHNESIWNYLIGICDNTTPSVKLDVTAFVEDLYDKTDEPKRSPYMVSFLGDVYLDRIEKGQDPELSYKRAKEFFEELLILDPVRKNYWKHMILRSNNLFSKRATKEEKEEPSAQSL